MWSISDYIFFGLIRNALEQLYHPTTFYGYGFGLSLPFIIAAVFRKSIERKAKTVEKTDFEKAGPVGTVSFGLLVLIIVLNISV